MSGCNDGGWSLSRFGQRYQVMALMGTSDGWVFDPVRSFTSEQLASRSPDGLATFPPSLNAHGETYYKNHGSVWRSSPRARDT